MYQELSTFWPAFFRKKHTLWENRATSFAKSAPANMLYLDFEERLSQKEERILLCKRLIAWRQAWCRFRLQSSLRRRAIPVPPFGLFRPLSFAGTPRTKADKGTGQSFYIPSSFRSPSMFRLTMTWTDLTSLFSILWIMENSVGHIVNSELFFSFFSENKPFF